MELVDSEFDQWNNKNQGEIYLLETKVKADGSLSVAFSICGENDFTLHFPPGYPNHNGKVVGEVETACLHAWCAALNEQLNLLTLQSLPEALSKAMQLYKSYRKTSYSSSEDVVSEDGEEALEEAMMEEDDDDDDADDEAFTTQWEIKIALKKKRWVDKEIKIREQMKKRSAKSGEGYTSVQIEKASMKQIFSTDASAGILTNDLIKIMSHEQETGIGVEPIEDNIYCWRVKLFNFEPRTSLNEDLRIIEQKFHYNYIEIELDFTMDFYPFFPPVLRVVRPRMKGAMMQRITNLEFLKLSDWNPVLDMLSVLQKVKCVLSDWARLETSSARNDIQKFPNGSYLKIEQDLLKLAMIGEINPRANHEYALQFEKAKAIIPVSKKKSAGSWAAGTGYGHTSRPGWDIESHLAAQKLKDIEIKDVLNNIKHGIKEHKKKLATKMQTNPSATDISNTEDTYEEKYIYNIIEGSALIPFLESKMHSVSILEVNRHAPLYTTIIGIIREIASHSELIALLDLLPQQKISILSCLSSLKDEASLILSMYERSSHEQLTQESAKNSTSFKEHQLAKDLVSLHDEVRSYLDTYCYNKNHPCPMEIATPGVDEDTNNEEMVYQRNLKALQFSTCSFITTGSNAHLLHPKLSKNVSFKQSQVFRIAQDLASLRKSLPLNLSSSIFVKIDDEQCMLLKILITGPEDTPYTGGCFVFDVMFPDKYPKVPPVVLLKTTGNGTVRFNPNLYNNGKVCLSLLGTWNGQKGEQWNETSTLLQVLVSIQSLILVPDPYFNEPGYEQMIGTAKGTESSRHYNAGIQQNTLHWAVLDQIVNPTPEFQDVIKCHFYFIRNKLIREISKWAEANANLKAKVASAVRALNNLTQPPTAQA